MLEWCNSLTIFTTEPHKNDLLSLLTSPHLVRSVLLIATHSPPPIPVLQRSTPGPNVCILRLSSPLAVHDSGALRLVKLLERAHRVAGRWRASPQISPLSLSEYRFVQFAECTDTGEFTVAEPFLFVDRHGKTVQNLSLALPPTLVQPRKFRLSAHSLLSLNGSPFTSTTSLPTSPSSLRGIQRRKVHRNSVTQPSPYSLSPPGSQDELRAFDALLNFLPSNVPDKALLKHAILVTTLSAQYLAMPDRVRTNATGDEFGLNHGGTSKATARFSAPGPSSYSFSSSHPSSTSSSMSHSASITTTPATSPSPSPSPPLTPSPFSQGSGESTNYLNLDAPRRKGSIKTSFARRFSSFLRSPSSSATSVSASFAIDGGTSGIPYANERVVDARANGGRDGYESADTKPHDTPTKLKNAHLLHILPLDWVDWEEQMREENIRDPQHPRDHSHTSVNLHRHHDVSGNVPSGSKRRTTGTSRVSEKPKLAQGIEQFLLTFAYPLGSLGLGPGNGESRRGVPSSSKSAQGHGDVKPALTGLAAAAAHAQARPVPYLLAPGVFGRALDGVREEYPRQRDGGKSEYDHLEEYDPRRTRRALIIGEIILLGALDFDPEKAYGQKDAYSRYFVEDRGNARAVGGGRAWVGVGDVICSKEEKRKETEREERAVVDREERDRRIRETERRLEASTSHRTSTNQATNISPNTRKATESQSPLQLPTPPDSSSSGESIEEDHLQDRYRTVAPPQQPTRVYASAKEPERQKDSARPSRRESIGASTSQKLGPGPNPAPVPMSRQPWPSSAQGPVRSTSRSTSNASVPASSEQPPPRPGRNPLRSESGTPPFSASAGIPSAQMHRVEGPAFPSSAYSYGSSPQTKESRQASTTSGSTPPSAKVIPLTPPSTPPSTWNELSPVRTPVTTRTQHEPKAVKDTKVNSARYTHGEQKPLPTRPRAIPISNSVTAAEASHRNLSSNLAVRDRGDFQQETSSNKPWKGGHDHGLGHAMRKLSLWKLKG